MVIGSAFSDRRASSAKARFQSAAGRKLGSRTGVTRGGTKNGVSLAMAHLYHVLLEPSKRSGRRFVKRFAPRNENRLAQRRKAAKKLKFPILRLSDFA